MNDIQLDSIESAIAAIKAGEVIIVVDDEDRENEGDFVCAGATITPEIVNFMATYGRGLICTPITEERAAQLKLNMMVPSNTALHETAFTVSIDYKGKGCTTGISAYDRSTCIQALCDSASQASDFARPGHIFPLVAKNGGVLRRTGHTEASIDLARLAGLPPVGVLVEILNEDGTMARLPDLVKIAKHHGLKIVSIKDLIAYRMKKERIIKKEFEFTMETASGSCEIYAFRQLTNDAIHLAIKVGEWADNEPVLVRAHSSTETGDIIGTLFDNYGVINKNSMQKIIDSGKGLFLYLRHGGQDGILKHLQQMKAEQEGIFIKEEGTASMEQRDFGIGAQILRAMNISKIRLITNNSRRRIGLMGYGLEIVETLEV